MATFPWTDLDLFPLALGGNVFGWTADERQSHAVLDAYAAAGGNHIDTADSYSRWAHGNAGGESETIIGRWLRARGNRDAMLIATKVGRFGRLTAANIRAWTEASLRRLQIDAIDLLYLHNEDPDVPLAEQLGALDELVRAGKVRALGVSNYRPETLAEALAICERDGLARPVALQPHYNLVERRADGIPFEGELQDLAVRERIAVFPYYALAMGFLAGKYRPGGDAGDSPRAGGAAAYLERPSGRAVLDALDAVAAARGTTVAAVALAWLLAQPAVAAPIASARTPEQLADLLPSARLELSADELARLTAASEGR